MKEDVNMDYRDRCQKAQHEMGEEGIDYLFIGVSSDMLYLTGYTSFASERLTLLVLPQAGDPTMIIPTFEARRLDTVDVFFPLRTWDETDDPMQMLRDTLGRNAARSITVGVGDQLWSMFLVRMLHALPKMEVVSASEVLAPLRMVKDADELDVMRKAEALAEQALTELLKRPLSGRTEQQVTDDLLLLAREAGMRPPMGCSVGSGPNGASPHHGSGDRIVEKGDAVVIDYVATYKGYCSDLTRTVHIGPPSDEYKEVHSIVREAQEAAFQAIRPGVTCESIDAAARQVISDAGYGEYFIHRVGHGLGLDVHEEPYMVEGNKMELLPGMTFSDEPGIYFAGRFGVRIEDIVAVTEDGAERFNTFTHDVVVVE